MFSYIEQACRINKNEIAFLWGDKDRECKGDWKRKNKETTRLLYLKESFLRVREIGQTMQMSLIWKKLFCKD